MKRFLSFFSLIFICAAGCDAQHSAASLKPYVIPDSLSKYAVATFSSGCFWCMEGVYESVKGVHEVISGYSGGHVDNPTYDDVTDEKTGHAESVQVYYDPQVVTYATLLKVYFGSQNPTQVDGQGPDEGDSYRSLIFYRTPEEKSSATDYKAEVQKNFKNKVAAQIIPFVKFWPAEVYHQNYIAHNPGSGYVRQESIPRIKRFQAKFPDLIKPDHKF